MRLNRTVFPGTLMLLAACNDAEYQSANAAALTWQASSAQQAEVRFAQLVVAGPGGLAISGKHPRGMRVGIIGAIDGRVLVRATGATTTYTDEDEDEPIELTRLAPALDRRVLSRPSVLAVLNYTGEPFARIAFDTVRDRALVDSLKRLVVTSGALRRLYAEMSESRQFDAEARRMYQRALPKTPTVRRLQIAEFAAYAVQFQIPVKYDANAGESDPVLLVINGTPFTAAGPCGRIDGAFRLGQRYYLDTHSYYCFSDVGGRSVYEVRRDTLRSVPLL